MIVAPGSRARIRATRSRACASTAGVNLARNVSSCACASMLPPAPLLKRSGMIHSLRILEGGNAMARTEAADGDTAEKLFNGYDSVANGMLDQCAVIGDVVTGGARSFCRIKVCESLSDLAEALEIDGSLS